MRRRRERERIDPDEMSAWFAALAHMHRLGYDVAPLAPERVRDAWYARRDMRAGDARPSLLLAPVMPFVADEPECGRIDATDVRDELWTAIHRRGAELSCPGCGARMVAVVSATGLRYFRHYRRPDRCASDGETELRRPGRGRSRVQHRRRDGRDANGASRERGSWQKASVSRSRMHLDAPTIAADRDHARLVRSWCVTERKPAAHERGAGRQARGNRLMSRHARGKGRDPNALEAVGRALPFVRFTLWIMIEIWDHLNLHNR